MSLKNIVFMRPDGSAFFVHLALKPERVMAAASVAVETIGQALDAATSLRIAQAAENLKIQRERLVNAQAALEEATRTKKRWSDAVAAMGDPLDSADDKTRRRRERDLSHKLRKASSAGRAEIAARQALEAVQAAATAAEVEMSEENLARLRAEPEERRSNLKADLTRLGERMASDAASREEAQRVKESALQGYTAALEEANRTGAPPPARPEILDCEAVAFDVQESPDLYWLDAWKWDATAGRLTIDTAKAVDIQTNMIRRQRYPALRALDIEYQRALEEGDEAKKAEIVARKKVMRDVTGHAALRKPKSLDALKAATVADLTGDSITLGTDIKFP